MNKTLMLLAALASVAVQPAMAARTVTLPLVHPTVEVYQAYPGNSENTNRGYAGFDGLRGDAITAVPGTLSIIPGNKWANFVSAAQSGVPYGLKNVVLIKQTPAGTACAEMFPSRSVPQHGTPNIRLWWPLMYELPSTTYTLSILYGTYTAWDDDGLGPNPAGYVHQDVWRWHVDATLDSTSDLLALFHELPFGTSEVPLISDEVLYAALQTEVEAGDLSEFKTLVEGACITLPPMNPDATGLGTGIANTPENPACCKLLREIEYLMQLH